TEALQGLQLAERGLTEREKAVEQLQSLAQTRPDAATHNRLAGLLRRDPHRAEEALLHFQRAVELAPDDPVAQGNLRQMLLGLDQPEAALPHCRQAVRLRPENPVL